MEIRKVAVAGMFAAGAALALAPMASAVPTDITSVVDSEVSSLNGLFASDAALTGVYGDITHPTDPGVFSIVIPSDVSTVQGSAAHLTPFDYLVYGVDPKDAGLASDPGAYNVFNGALTEFDNAYNVELYALLNGGATAPATDVFSHPEFLEAGATQAATDYFNFGVGDLEGYFGIFPQAGASAAADPAAGFDITPILTSEIASLNSLFTLDATLASVPPADVVPGPQGFLVISPADATADNSIFNTLVFGAAGPSSDPGSYDVLNGALGQFDNAYNVGLFALLDPTGTFNPADIIGTHDFLGDGLATAAGEYLQLGFSDLLGYFIPAAASSLVP
jgi:hypothetical protein